MSVYVVTESINHAKPAEWFSCVHSVHMKKDDAMERAKESAYEYYQDEYDSNKDKYDEGKADRIDISHKDNDWCVWMWSPPGDDDESYSGKTVFFSVREKKLE